MTAASARGTRCSGACLASPLGPKAILGAPLLRVHSCSTGSYGRFSCAQWAAVGRATCHAHASWADNKFPSPPTSTRPASRANSFLVKCRLPLRAVRAVACRTSD